MSWRDTEEGRAGSWRLTREGTFRLTVEMEQGETDAVSYTHLTKLGPTIVHFEMEEITDAAEKISDEDAKKTLEALKSRTGQVKCSEECMIWMAKVYMATKAIIEDMGLNAIAAECYPCLLYTSYLTAGELYLPYLHRSTAC